MVVRGWPARSKGRTTFNRLEASCCRESYASALRSRAIVSYTSALRAGAPACRQPVARGWCTRERVTQGARQDAPGVPGVPGVPGRALGRRGERADSATAAVTATSTLPAERQHACGNVGEVRVRTFYSAARRRRRRVSARTFARHVADRAMWAGVLPQMVCFVCAFMAIFTWNNKQPFVSATACHRPIRSRSWSNGRSAKKKSHVSQARCNGLLTPLGELL